MISSARTISAAVGGNGIVAHDHVHERLRSDIEIARGLIESHGGQVSEGRRIGRIKPNPFPGMRFQQSLFEFRVKFGNRGGTIFARTGNDERGPEFAWVPNDNSSQYPDTTLAMSTHNDGTSRSLARERILILAWIATGVVIAISIAIALGL